MAKDNKAFMVRETSTGWALFYSHNGDWEGMWWPVGEYADFREAVAALTTMDDRELIVTSCTMAAAGAKPVKCARKAHHGELLVWTGIENEANSPWITGPEVHYASVSMGYGYYRAAEANTITAAMKIALDYDSPKAVRAAAKKANVEPCPC